MRKIIEFKDLIEIENYKENNKVYKVSVLDKSLAKDFNNNFEDNYLYGLYDPDLCNETINTYNVVICKSIPDHYFIITINKSKLVNWRLNDLISKFKINNCCLQYIDHSIDVDTEFELSKNDSEALTKYIQLHPDDTDTIQSFTKKNNYYTFTFLNISDDYKEFYDDNDAYKNFRLPGLYQQIYFPFYFSNNLINNQITMNNLSDALHDIINDYFPSDYDTIKHTKLVIEEVDDWPEEYKKYNEIRKRNQEFIKQATEVPLKLYKKLESFIYTINDSSRNMKIANDDSDIQTFFTTDTTDIELIIVTRDTSKPIIKLIKDTETKNIKFIIDITTQEGDNFKISTNMYTVEQFKALIDKSCTALHLYDQFAKYADDLEQYSET